MKSAIWKHLWGNASDRPALDKDEATPEALAKTAAAAGLNASKLETDMRGQDCAEWLRDSEEILRAFNAGATPAFFINGRFVAGGPIVRSLRQTDTGRVGHRESCERARLLSARGGRQRFEESEGPLRRLGLTHAVEDFSKPVSLHLQQKIFGHQQSRRISDDRIDSAFRT